MFRVVGKKIKKFNFSQMHTFFKTSQESISPNCNAASYVDTLILTPNHMLPNPTCLKCTPPCINFDPDGLVNYLFIFAY